MTRIIPTGIQVFEELRKNDLFYIDKTHFISDWWKRMDAVTLITRPRRFGKTLLLDTVRTFLSPEFADRPELFAGLAVSRDPVMCALRGTVPVIFISFASIKGSSCRETLDLIKSALISLYDDARRHLDFSELSDTEREQFASVRMSMSEAAAQTALQYLSKYLSRHYSTPPVILLDEYDTPLQEAWLNGYWSDLVRFMRGFFNSSFKTNFWLGRGLLTGITRISKESLFSDLNNLEVVTTSSDLYTDCFGFTEAEVFTAMDEYGMTDKDDVRRWYDGFVFGSRRDMYNPWSIIGYLKHRRFAPYWAQTSSNAMVGELLGYADGTVKTLFEDLLAGKSVTVTLDEQIVFDQLRRKPGALWSFLTACGYLKILACDHVSSRYELALTNFEVQLVVETLVSEWFGIEPVAQYAQEFRHALVEGRVARLNTMLKAICEQTFSCFDTAGHEPERFYHGFVLGLLVDMKERYILRSNRESGFGRYDVMLVPRSCSDPGVIIEFKSLAEDEGETKLEETAAAALHQIHTKGYAAELEAAGISKDMILAYGIAFRGRNTLVTGGRYWQ